MAYGTPRAVTIRDLDGDEIPICTRCLKRLVSLGLVRFKSLYDQDIHYQDLPYGGVERAVASDKLVGIERPILEGQHQDELDKTCCDLCGKSLRTYCTDY